MHAELSDHRKIRGHFGRAIRGDGDRFAADKNIERAGVKDDPPILGAHFFPVFRRIIVIQLRQIDDAGMALRAIADQIAVFRF